MFEPMRLRSEIASDTMDLYCDGLHGMWYCQVSGNKEMFAEAYLIAAKNDCDDALREFLMDYGAPDLMISDESKEQTLPGTRWQARSQKNNIPSVVTPPH